ncbi:hypothetical protein [Paenibacillus agri]|uniref:Uncharacterized protein n=1 Tax=Paenibacillus agri TaxID=2744309 RepID=A0A850ERX1_9BACL|nr:hypothetical protein [Paenibacillus agri]NUU62479.1 hypothetical protein [Paenibacillus agri]
MVKPWKIAIFSFIGIIVFLMIDAAVYIHNIGYNNIKQMYRLQTTGLSIVQIESDTSGYERYLTKAEQPQELLKARMKKEGWTYISQEGAGYFFEKDGQQEIVTMKKWNHFYMIYDLKLKVANLAD